MCESSSSNKIIPVSNRTEMKPRLERDLPGDEGRFQRYVFVVFVLISREIIFIWDQTNERKWTRHTADQVSGTDFVLTLFFAIPEYVARVVLRMFHQTSPDSAGVVAVNRHRLDSMGCSMHRWDLFTRESNQE